MIAAWMAYAALVGLALGGAALLAERGLRAVGRPGRGAWVAAMAGSVLVPGWSLLRAFGPDGGAAASGGTAVEIGPLAVGAPEAGVATPAAWEGMAAAAISALGPLDGPIALAWALAASGLFGLLLASWWRLRRERRGWTRVPVDGYGVHVSEAYGPAVFGFFRTGVVVPRWFLTLTPEDRRLALLHEREHARAGDPRLTLAGLLLTLALPWNPALWWQLRRLRLAVEVDCDRRVLARGVRSRPYGRLLLAVAGGGDRNPMAAPALVEGAGDLERRLEMLSEKRPGRPALRAGLALIAASGLLVLACEAPVPPEPRDEAEGAAAAEPRAVEPIPPPNAVRGSERPTFIPYDTPPRLQNVLEVQASLRDRYPADLREAGVEGRVELWLLIDDRGRVANLQVKTSSEIEALDRAALEVAGGMEFRPAEHEGVPTKVWVTQWISFELGREIALAAPRLSRATFPRRSVS